MMRAPLQRPSYPTSAVAVKHRFSDQRARRTLRGEINSTPSLFVQSSAAIDGLYAVTSAREFVSRISGDEMKPTRVRLPKNTLFQGDTFRGDAFRGDAFRGDPSKPDLEALKTAKARQDASHRKLDRFITAALAELSNGRRTG